MVGPEKGDGPRIRVTSGGPYIVSGGVPLLRETIVCSPEGATAWEEGERIETQPRYLLCRCGHSGRKPFCDGSHLDMPWDGTETAARTCFHEQAETIHGPRIDLRDVAALCSEARFCAVRNGIWNAVTEAETPEAAACVVEWAGLCPSGRYVPVDAETGEAIEPEFEPSIGLIDDPGQKVSGPLWVRGGIPVEAADGYEYEVRNRVTLCRCGKSENKPFCDGTHCTTGFNDKD